MALRLGARGNASDRASVHQVLSRYFFALDRRDYSEMLTCFSPDVEASYESIKVADSADRLIDFLQHRRPAIDSLEGEITDSMHAMSTHWAIWRANECDADTYAIAHLRVGGREGFTHIERGLRYRDTLHRLRHTWVIRRRDVSLIWTKTSSPASWPTSQPKNALEE